MREALQALVRRNRVAWPLLAGLLMLVAALSLWIFAARPLAHHNQRLAQQARLASERPAAVPRVLDGPAEQLRRYEQALPHADAAVESVARIHRIGTSAGLSLPSGEYRMERGGDARLVRYRVSLPVAGSYPQIRAFVLDVLRELPAAALDDIQLRRDPAGGRIEARVRFSLYLRTN